jgi:hypothetical protein
MSRSVASLAYCMLALGSVVACLLMAVDPALALGGEPQHSPAPLIGVGLPIAGGVVVALLLVRRFRKHG